MSTPSESMQTLAMLRDAMTKLAAGFGVDIYTTRPDEIIDRVIDGACWRLLDVRVRWYCIRRRPLPEAFKIDIKPLPRKRPGTLFLGEI